MQKQKDSKSKQREHRHAFGERRSSIGALSSPVGTRGAVPTHIMRGEDVTPEQRGWNGSVERPALRTKVGAFGAPPPLAEKSNSWPSAPPATSRLSAINGGKGGPRMKSRTPISKRAHAMDVFKGLVSVELKEIDMLRCNPHLNASGHFRDEDDDAEGDKG